ncbi:hypothetical protein R1sor_005717 [Riccia sorocarpa]|uniref:DDE Tnp4 domain-containing protein n=1 Tax=Riccia sorocarpa TaxID=122646 RepID=A0ABD3HPK7_9MARC
MPKRLLEQLVQVLGPKVAKSNTKFRKAVRADEFMPEVIDAIIRYLGLAYLKWPSATEMEKLTRKFERKTELPNIQGAIDCTFVKVRVPQREADCYFNRKWYVSLVLQAVTDSDGVFLDISCSLPGSVIEKRVLRRSRFYEKVQSGANLSEPVLTINDGFRLSPYILGDAGYVLHSWIMMLIALNLSYTAAERLFIERQIRGGICVECAFRILKARWRILVVGTSSDIS